MNVHAINGSHANCGTSTAANTCTPNATNATVTATPTAATPAARASITTYQPSFDLLRTAEGLVLHADMPGAKAAAISVTFEQRQLRIEGPVSPRTPEGAHTLREEYGVGDYLLTLAVKDDVDADRISAAYADGVLTVTLPRPAALQPRKIEVRPANPA